MTTAATKALVFSDWRLFLAFGGGVGLSPWAAGTMGTLLAVPIFLAADFFFPSVIFPLAAIFFIVGIPLCDWANQAMGIADDGGIVWDEFAAFFFVMAITPPTWWIAAFVIFRVFDILKPPPIRWVDSQLKNGFGVMFDDFLAAVFTVILTSGIHWGIG